MKIVRNLLLLLAILLFGTLAHGKKKKQAESSRPVVVVMNLRVDSENPNVQAKIVELTAKVRDQVAESTDTCAADVNTLGTLLSLAAETTATEGVKAQSAR